MERGVVLSPQFSYLPTGQVLFKSAVDDFELRKYLTYWDKIDIPKSSFIEFDCQQFRTLESSGHLIRTPYGSPQSFRAVNLSNVRQLYLGNAMSARIDDCTNMTLNRSCGDQILQAHEDVYLLQSGKEPGQWSKAQVSTSLLSFDPEDKPAIEIELYNMLPVPSANTPLEDILEFKLQHHDELVAFRCYLDEMYQQIIGAADIPKARNSQLNRLEQAVRDVDRTMRESRIRAFPDSLRSVLSGLDGIVGTGLAVGGTVAATSFGVPPLVAGLASAAVIAGTKMIPQSKGTTKNDLTYLKSLRSNFR
ncbi:DUF6236 family protein [Vibrio alginolyticus]|uniref:DUF6236 family protein n=1 Tax=Vibrio alginolyticus TaxID=663 RepID=UPI00215C4B4F|nr:DUF6236 family protein [Vibrio alginolyticus]MCR9921812.1 DUF6236 family protein [Vibrio alginolyticus]